MGRDDFYNILAYIIEPKQVFGRPESVADGTAESAAIYTLLKDITFERVLKKIFKLKVKADIVLGSQSSHKNRIQI